MSASTRAPTTGVFRSLRMFNYRLWAAGSLASNIVSLRKSELRSNARARRSQGGFAEAIRYVWGRPDLKAMLVMLFLIGTFGLNFPIFISTMAASVFHSDARGYGVLSSMMALGTGPADHSGWECCRACSLPRLPSM